MPRTAALPRRSRARSPAGRGTPAAPSASSAPRASGASFVQRTAATVPGGLVWVSDAEPGLRRVRQDGGFAYVDVHGRPVDDAETLARIRKLAVPPAYEDVWICARADGHLQATGRDARGRKQYRYHPLWQLQRGEDKFASLRAFGNALPRIRRCVQRDLASANTARPHRRLVLATLVRLLDATFVRIGNEEYARGNGSYGLSTLRARHAGVRDTEVRLTFKGKGGVPHEVALADPRVANVVRRCKALPGQELFQYADADGSLHKVTSADVNDYLSEIAGMRITAKDFRTWHASVLALEYTLLACCGEPVRGAAAQVVEQVARRLRNTAAVCRKSYIHPLVLELGQALADDAARAALQQQRWATAAGIGAAPRALSAAERRLLALLGRRPGGGRRAPHLPDAQRPSGRQRPATQGRPCRRSPIS